MSKLVSLRNMVHMSSACNLKKVIIGTFRKTDDMEIPFYFSFTFALIFFFFLGSSRFY